MNHVLNLELIIIKKNIKIGDMGAKKKVQVSQPPPPVPQEKVVHNVYTFKTRDNVEFKLSEELISKYSTKLKSIIDNVKQENILLDEIDSKHFQVISQYLNLHKEKQPMKISVPIKTNQHLKYIMQESDAQLIDKCMQKGDNFIFKLLDLVHYLDIQSLRRRLACGVALKLMKSTLEELKEDYQIDKDNINQDQLKSQIRPTIDTLRFVDQENNQ